MFQEAFEFRNAAMLRSRYDNVPEDDENLRKAGGVLEVELLEDENAELFAACRRARSSTPPADGRPTRFALRLDVEASPPADYPLQMLRIALAKTFRGFRTVIFIKLPPRFQRKRQRAERERREQSAPLAAHWTTAGDEKLEAQQFARWTTETNEWPKEANGGEERWDEETTKRAEGLLLSPPTFGTATTSTFAPSTPLSASPTLTATSTVSSSSALRMDAHQWNEEDKEEDEEEEEEDDADDHKEHERMIVHDLHRRPEAPHLPLVLDRLPAKFADRRFAKPPAEKKKKFLWFAYGH